MFKRIDIFGRQINLRFNKRQTYQSNFGSFITLIIFTFIFYRFLTILISAIKGSRPNVNYSERQVDNPSIFKANPIIYPIAFGMEHPITRSYYIDESIYTVRAQIQQKYQIYNSSQNSNVTVWEYQNVILEPCTDQSFQNPENKHYYLSLDYKNMYCISPETKLDIQGDFNSPIFQSIEFFVQRCQVNCKSEKEINYYLMKGVLGLQLSDAYVDPNSYENPFKIYSRDLFFPTSLSMTKEVQIYIRNNYIYSDQGLIQTETKVQKYPQFSYYETFVFPSNFDDYFLQFTIRFEKQKENVYYRSYQDFLGIMSEIGGLTQSFLAIGFLICRYVTQAKLNQQIIKQIFKYEELDDNFQEQEISPKENKNSINKQNEDQSQNIQLEIPTDQDKTYLSNASNLKLKRKPQFNNITQQADQQKQNKKMNSEGKSNILDNSVNSQNETKNYNLFMKKKSIYGIMQKSQINSKSNNKDNTQSQHFEQKQFLNQLLQNNQSCELQQRSSVSPNHSTERKLHKKIVDKKIEELNSRLKKKNDKSINKLLKKQTKSMEMSFWQYLISLICPFGRLKKKKEIIDYSVDKLYQNLDILQILKRLIEVEKIKRLILNQDQIKLFDYLPKPTINYNFTSKKLQKQIQEQDFYKNQEINLLYQDNRSEFQKIKDAYEAYKNILTKEDFSELDQKLVDMLDSNIVDIFEAQDLNLTDINLAQQQSVHEQQQILNLKSSEQNQNQEFQDALQKNIKSKQIQNKLIINSQSQSSSLGLQNQSLFLQYLQYDKMEIRKENSFQKDEILLDDESNQGEVCKEDNSNILFSQFNDLVCNNPFLSQLKK